MKKGKKVELVQDKRRPTLTVDLGKKMQLLDQCLSLLQAMKEKPYQWGSWRRVSRSDVMRIAVQCLFDLLKAEKFKWN